MRCNGAGCRHGEFAYQADTGVIYKDVATLVLAFDQFCELRNRRFL